VGSILIKTLRDQRQGLFWWFIGVTALGLVTVLLYPSIGAAPEMERLLDELPPVAQVFIGDIVDITSPTGYLNSQLFILMVPLLFIIYTIGQGSGAIAGEEHAGTMDLLLANPVPRWQVVIEKYSAQVAGAAVIALANWTGIVIGAVIVEMEISLFRIFEATLAALMLSYTFGAFALMLGSATGKRGLSIGVAAGIGVVTYLLNGFALIIDWLEPYRILSPFYFYSGSDPLVNGLDVIHTLILIALAAVLLLVAVATFDRRDVQV
jgi:ABC-2 type transport system permease protein